LATWIWPERLDIHAGQENRRFHRPRDLYKKFDQAGALVVGADGKLVREWRGVKVPGHAEEVLAAVKAL
jgi:hypothetical protein